MRRLGMILLAILFLFMVFAGPAAPKTEAVVVSTVVIGAVIAAMAAAGIGLTVSGMTSAQLSDWVDGKLNDWATSLGGSVQDHIDNNLITMTANGIIAIGTSAAQGISSFISWLVNGESLTDNSDKTIYMNTSVLLLDTEKYYSIARWDYKYLSIEPKSWGPLYVVMAHDGVYTGPLVASANENGNYASYWVQKDDSGFVSADYGQYTSSYGSLRDVTTINGVTLHYKLQPSSPYGNIEMSYVSVYNTIQDGLNAIAAAISSDNYGDSLSANTGVITIPTIAEGDKWFLDVGADPGVTVETATDGVIADTIDGTLTVSGEVAEEEPEFEVTGPIGISGLTEVFPFCIPFDVYDLLSCLSADPQTPIFTVRFVIPGVINQEFTIDLTPFNAVAQIVRTMELIAFAIGLALVTRERFLRS